MKMYYTIAECKTSGFQLHMLPTSPFGSLRINSNYILVCYVIGIQLYSMRIQIKNVYVNIHGQILIWRSGADR